MYCVWLTQPSFQNSKIKIPEDELIAIKGDYPSTFDFMPLKIELSIIYADDIYKNHGLEQIILALNENDTKDNFKGAYKLFLLVLTIPPTSCSVERKFSCLKI